MAYPKEKEYIEKVNKRLEEAVEPTTLKHEESGAYEGVVKPDEQGRPSGPYSYGDNTDVGIKTKKKKKSVY